MFKKRCFLSFFKQIVVVSRIKSSLNVQSLEEEEIGGGNDDCEL